VDIEAVDTHRPKIKKSTSIRKLKSHLTLLAVGASGEIVRDPMSPIIPISPQLFPKNSSSTSSSASNIAKGTPYFDLGDAALP
jgi:6-phosphofructo-2-kinase/fructose-2,6-biphosphatase 2